MAKAKEQLYGKSEGGQTSQDSSQGKGGSEDKYQLLKIKPDTLDEDQKEERRRLLIEKYVDDYKKRKEEEKESLLQELGEGAKTKEETRQSEPVTKSKGDKAAEGLDKFMEYGGHASDILGGGTQTVTEILGAAGVEGKGLDKTSNIAGMASGAWGTLSGIYGTGKGIKDVAEKKGVDERAARLAGFDIAGSVFGAASGATGFTGSLFADREWGKRGDENPVADTLGNISAGLGFVGSGIGLAKSSYQTHTYKKLAQRRETDMSQAKMLKKYGTADRRYKELKDKYRQDKKSLTKAEKMEMLRQRYVRKRSRDYMEALRDAQISARQKASEGAWGVASGTVNTLGSGLGLMGGLFKQFAGDNNGLKIAGTVLSIAGGLLGLVAKGVEIGGKIYQDKQKEKSKEERAKNYLKEKAAKLKAKPEPRSDHMTDEEAELIIAKRLGVKNPSNYQEVFQKLAERRADRILNKEEGYREVLAALGLSEKADKATIMEALGA